MIGRLAARRLSNLQAVKPTRMALRRNADFAHASAGVFEDVLLLGIWIGCIAHYMKMPSSTGSFDYRGFQPKPKLFAAFQFPRV